MSGHAQGPLARAGLLTLADVALTGKRILVRVDFNTPLSSGHIDDDTRIRAGLPGIEQILAAGGRPIIVSHLGRPAEGRFAQEFSLQPVAERLGTLLGRPVRLWRDWDRDGTEGADALKVDVLMLENIRFACGEQANDERLARRLAALCDVYVNDAFASAHRAHASTCGVAQFAPIACAGPQLLAEIAALARVLDEPARPVVAIIGGAKVSTKLAVLENLLEKVDTLILGGGIANTFLAAAGYSIGQSLAETALLDEAKKLLRQATQGGKRLPLPVDVICAKALGSEAAAVNKPVTAIAADDLVLDIGTETASIYARHLADAATILWNGPVGVFEFDQFAQGTASLAQAIAGSQGFAIAGGGDTLAAIARFEVGEHINYISTGGGAFLAQLQGRPLPAVAVLHAAARRHCAQAGAS